MTSAYLFKHFNFISFYVISACIVINILKTRTVTELEKLLVHGSLVGLVLELRLNR